MHREERIVIDLGRDMQSEYAPEVFADGATIGESQVVFFGPYCSLPAGRWIILVEGVVSTDGFCRVDAAASSGRLILGEGTWRETSCKFEIENAFPLDGFEIRLHASPGSFVQISKLSLTRTMDLQAQRSFQMFDRMGLSLLLDPTSLVDRHIIERGSWDHEHLAYMREFAFNHAGLSRELIFLDIGSYFGLYAMMMARTSLFEKVIAFEADHLNFRQLCGNLLLNDPSCLIEPRFVAVSDRDGTAVFESSIHHPDGNRGGVGLNEQGAPTDSDKTVVTTEMIDQLIDVTGRKIFAKIDVEGHEIGVLRGMIKTIAENDVLLQIETFFQAEAVDDLLRSMGCHRVHRIGDDYYYSNLIL